MSAPDTNLEKQTRRHRGPLIGITLALLFVGGMFVWFMGWTASDGEPPVGADTQIDGRTGDTVEGAAAPAADGAAPSTSGAAPDAMPATPEAPAPDEAVSPPAATPAPDAAAPAQPGD